MDSAPRSLMSDASSFTFSASQARASAMVAATLGKTARISSLVISLLFMVIMCNYSILNPPSTGRICPVI